MTSAVLGLYYGNEHVYGSLTMPAMDGHPAHHTLLSFSGARFLTDENPLSHGVFLPITTDVGQKILDSYARTKEQFSRRANPFYFTEDGTPIEQFETGWNPRQATNCCHYILALCKEAGVPLESIAGNLCPTFSTKELEHIIDKELRSPESFADAHGTFEKLKEVQVLEPGGPSKLFFFGFAYERPIAYGFDDITLTRTAADGRSYEQGIIEYLSHQPPLSAPSVSTGILPEKIQKILETGGRSGTSAPAVTSNPCHKR